MILNRDVDGKTNIYCPFDYQMEGTKNISTYIDLFYTETTQYMFNKTQANEFY